MVSMHFKQLQIRTRTPNWLRGPLFTTIIENSKWIVFLQWLKRFFNFKTGFAFKK